MASNTHNQQLKDKIKHLLLKYGVLPLIFMTGKALPSCSSESKDAPKAQTEIQKKIPTPQVTQATTNIVFATDTLEAPTSALMYFTHPDIIRNFVPNYANHTLYLSVLVHEQKHKDNYNKKMSLRPLTPMQYANMRIDDEISASMCELLTLRFEYLAAPTPEKKQSIVEYAQKRRFSYYFDAIKSGQLHPEKTDSLSREQEWKFIAQETEKMWMNKLWPYYRPAITRMVERYLDRIPTNLSQKQTDNNYRKARQIAYNIGGVDFLKYLPERNEIADKTIEIMNGVAQLNILGANKKEYLQRVNANINKLKHQKQILTPEIIAHIYKAEGLKMALHGIDRDILLKYPNIVTSCYHKIDKQFSSSVETEKLYQTTLSKENPLHNNQTTETPPEIISQLYTHKNVDLTTLIIGFQKDTKPFPFMQFKTSNLSPDQVLLQMELENMRKLSNKNTETLKPSTQPKQTSRRSAPISIKAPDFSQPILISATQEQTEEIYNSIREFDQIPQVMKECNLEAQKAFLKKQKQLSK